MTCPTGKATYATSAAAARVMQRMDKRHGGQKSAQWFKGKTAPYRCALCGGWHIGHGVSAVKNKRPRIAPDMDWSFA